jgi:hypothetical protein
VGNGWLGVFEVLVVLGLGVVALEPGDQVGKGWEGIIVEGKPVVLDLDVLGDYVVVLRSVVEDQELGSFNGEAEAVRDHFRVFFLFLFDGVFDLLRAGAHELGVASDVLDVDVAGLDISGIDFVDAFELLVFQE